MGMVRQRCVSAFPPCIHHVQFRAHLCHLSCLVPHIQTHFCPLRQPSLCQCWPLSILWCLKIKCAPPPTPPCFQPGYLFSSAPRPLLNLFALKHSHVRGEARWVEDSWGTISLSPVARAHHGQVTHQKPRHPPHLLLLPVRLLGHQGLLISLLQS